MRITANRMKSGEKSPLEAFVVLVFNVNDGLFPFQVVW